MTDHAKLDDLFLDTPASQLLNDTEAALFERMRTDWEGELADHVESLSARAAADGRFPDTEDLLNQAVEAMIGRLCAEDTQVQIGGEGPVTLTLDLIEVDVRPSLLAPALLADGFRVPARN